MLVAALSMVIAALTVSLFVALVGGSGLPTTRGFVTTGNRAVLCCAWCGQTERRGNAENS